MKKLLFLLLIFTSINSYNQKNDFAKQHFRDLRSLNNSANILFAKILALELGKQFSKSNDCLNKDLLLCSSNLRQQAEQISRNFAANYL